MNQSKWIPQYLDNCLSPYSGLTRQSWLEAGKFLLNGIFQNIKNFEDPVVMPRHETEISYPNKNSAPHKIQAEYFEGLARSFFIAAPLLKNEPELEIAGYSLKNYYKSHILRACTEGDKLWVLSLKYMQEHDHENKAFQQTVEMAALVICLWVCRSVIWESYTRQEKDVIAAFISEYAHGNTIPHNWRFFNMLGLAFLHMEGYPIDKEIMRDHAASLLSLYVGDGWYRDGHAFDYYSCWAFNLYAPIWNVWYGYQEEPYLAARFEENSRLLMKTYGDFFDKDGFTNMWGRSGIYRNGATSAFIGHLFLNGSAQSVNYGWARRIASGSLLQFLGRDDLWYQGIPVLGFYRPFAPMIQDYSCAESPLWMAKAFLCLYFPEDHPFWTETENNGSWEQLMPGQNKVTTLNGPALSYINHQANGITELRTGKVLKAATDERGMWNYAKLVYNTKFPWEAKPVPEVESQQYVLYDGQSTEYKKGNALFWAGEKDEVLYRRAYLGYSAAAEKLWTPSIDLADMAMPYGILRIDRIRFFAKPLRLTLGAYGFPDNTTEIIHQQKSRAKAIILKGYDHMGKPKQLAMTIFAGWQDLDIVASSGTNADSEKSLVVYAHLKREKQYGYEPYVLVSQVITKESLEDFSEHEIFPLKAITYADPEQCGGYGPVVLSFHDGSQKEVNYYGLEGNLSE
ncbi:DUF2264 domain-containing protein [Clostridiales bacterium COT073_COT-073]|nr:DUF2264 domain-containing protein [Clostridiales bacterium COT073_COT-073]